MVKCLSTMRETWVQSLGWEDPLEKEMAIHSRTITWKIPWTEEPGSLQPMGSQRVRHDWATSLHFTSLNGKTDAEAEAPVLLPPDKKSWLIWKDPDAEKDWRQEVKGVTEDEMVGWHHWINGHEFEQTLGDCEGQGSLACYSPWGYKELDMTEQLNNSNKWQMLGYLPNEHFSL